MNAQYLQNVNLQMQAANVVHHISVNDKMPKIESTQFDNIRLDA